MESTVFIRAFFIYIECISDLCLLICSINNIKKFYLANDDYYVQYFPFVKSALSGF